MTNVLERWNPAMRSTRRARRQLHSGEPFRPALEWSALGTNELDTIGGQSADQAILAFLRHQHVPAEMVRMEVLRRAWEALDPYTSAPGSSRLNLRTIREILDDQRFSRQEKVELLSSAWSSKSGLEGEQSGFAEPYAAAMERRQRLAVEARSSRSREARIAGEFLARTRTLRADEPLLQQYVDLLRQCEDKVLEVFWALLEDELSKPGFLRRERVRDLVDQAHLVLQ